jgi:hypothetical protein
VHTLYRRDRWLVEREHAGGLSFHRDRASAIYAGQVLADSLGVDHVIHARGGLIEGVLSAEAEQPARGRPATVTTSADPGGSASPGR